MHAWIVRHLTYPLWQRHTRGRVLPVLTELKRTQWLPERQMIALQLSRLRTLLAHADSHVPFYRESFRRAGLTPRDIRSLSDLPFLPILEKTSLRDHAALLTATGLSAALVKRQTSGSTGIPIMVWATAEARDAWVAASLRAMDWWKVRIGDRKLTLISRHDLTWRGWLKQLTLANVVEYSAMDLTDRTLDRLRWWLTRGRVRLLLGYPTSLEYLARAIGSRIPGRPLDLAAVFTTGEVLHPHQRSVLQEVFGCQVVDEYGSAEVGHIAAECPHGQMHIAAENVIVEWEPAQEGMNAHRELLVTDLTNFAMPLIRYRIGDLGAPAAPCPCGRGMPVLRLGVGRTSDLVVLPGGRRADFSVFDAVPEEVSARGVPLRQFRVLQHAEDHFEILLAGPDAMAGVLEHVRRRMLAALDPSVRIDVRAVSAIPPDPTGKRRRFISYLSGPSR